MKKTIFVLISSVLLNLALKSQAQTIHSVGEKYGGGIVFDVTAKGLHGLIAETQDQSIACPWLKANEAIKELSNHSETGKSFTDWRLPTKDELQKLYMKNSIVGSFANNFYWSSSEKDEYTAWTQEFNDGGQANPYKVLPCSVRAIRAF